MALDLLIRGGRVVDGTGSPSRDADVAVAGGRVIAVGQLEGASADRMVDASGRIVCPGFVDCHSHADITLLSGDWVDLRLGQGITTEVVGQDGLGYAPASPVHLAEWRRYLVGLNGDLPGVRWDWTSVAQLMSAYQDRPANTVVLVPHGTVRVEAMGWAARPGTADEMCAMAGMVAQGMEEGAAGLSTGLSYVPCAHANTDELASLCAPVARAAGILSIHLRSYIGELMQSLEEAFEIARRTGVAVHVSHLRMCDPLTWGWSGKVLEAIDYARAQGLDVTFDIYPYTAGCAPLFAMLPLWAQAGGPDGIMARLANATERKRITAEMCGWTTDWPAYVLSSAAPNPLGDWSGLSLATVADSLKLEVPDLVVQLLCGTNLDATIVADGGNEADNDAMFAHPAAMVCSDGVLPGQFPHPRGYGTFPRVLARYVREKRMLSWEEAIFKMTGAPAAHLRLLDRGVVRPGAAADLVVLSPQEVADRATFERGRLAPSGIPWVVVNGQVVIDHGRYVGGDRGRAPKALQREWRDEDDSTT